MASTDPAVILPAIEHPSSAESWRPVVNYEGLYEVSNLGNVRWIGPARGRTHPGRLLRPGVKARGYRHVSLSRDGVSRSCNVAPLVAAAFVGPRPSPRHDVDHVDNDPSNDAASNLQWVTHAENIRRSWARGRVAHRTPRKLSAVVVDEIRARVGAGESQRSVAAWAGVSQCLVSKIAAGLVWRMTVEP